MAAWYGVGTITSTAAGAHLADIPLLQWAMQKGATLARQGAPNTMGVLRELPEAMRTRGLTMAFHTGRAPATRAPVTA